MHRSKTQCFTGRLGPTGRHESCPSRLLDCATTRRAIHGTRAFPTMGQSVTAKGYPIFATGDLWKSK
jgi:hypothetical protein